MRGLSFCYLGAQISKKNIFPVQCASALCLVSIVASAIGYLLLILCTYLYMISRNMRCFFVPAVTVIVVMLIFAGLTYCEGERKTYGNQ